MAHTHVVYGWSVYTTTQRRDRVANRARTAATNNGFLPSLRIPGYEPGGVITYNWTAPTPSPDVNVFAGQTYPAVRLCYETNDKALADAADAEIQSEMESQGWIQGSHGVWTDNSDG